MKIKYVKFILYISFIILFIFSHEAKADNETADTNNSMSVTYDAHVEDIGWQDWKKEGETAGTTGQCKQVEALKIKLTNNVDNLNIKYQTHVQDMGWQDWKQDGEMAGTTGLCKQVEAIKIILSDDSNYSVIYRAHVKDIGWQDWKQDGEMVGTTGQDKRIEAIEIKIIKKADTKIHIKYQAHVSDIGWQNWVKDEELAGTTGKNKKIEAIKIQLYNAPIGSNVKYRTYLQDTGWQDWKQNGEMAGTTGQNKRIEAIEIKIEGVDGYTVEYESHVENIGWQSWASNEMTSGTVDQCLQIEAIKIRIVKNEETVVPQIKYSVYTTNNTWSGYLTNGNTARSTSDNQSIKAIKIKLQNVSNNSTIKYRAHVQNIGWMSQVTNDTQAGVTNQSNSIEALYIKLSELSGYSVEYRTYVNGKGWQDFVRDGIISGTTGEDKQIGAIEIKLNIDIHPHNDSDYSNIDISKYPKYKELLDKLQIEHPNWNFKLLYTGLDFNDVVGNEYQFHDGRRERNLVPKSYLNTGDWICEKCGTAQYDTGWYGASKRAISYYMDPRNFISETNIFQFLDVNYYSSDSCTADGINRKISGTYLANYGNDINIACRNKGVNPYYVIARLIQEQGTKGGSTWKMWSSDDNKYYYNPFNIGASGKGISTVIANALNRAKKEGWDSMEKAIEGGIYFLKYNWLDNYQNTLYQNKFDIDVRSGQNGYTGPNYLYQHEYMQNLIAAYNEALTLKNMYSNTGKMNSKFTFIIPVYENMNSTLYAKP